MTLALQKLGLTRDDVTVKEYGGGARRLAGGEVRRDQGHRAQRADRVAWRAREGVNVLVDLVPEQIPWLFSGIVVRRADIAARRDVLTRFLKASIEGNYLALTDEKRAKEVLAKELKITDPKILDITYNDFKQQSPPNLEPSREGAQNILKQFPDGSRKVGDYVDSSLLDALKNEGFFAAMEQKYEQAKLAELSCSAKAEHPVNSGVTMKRSGIVFNIRCLLDRPPARAMTWSCCGFSSLLTASRLRPIGRGVLQIAPDHHAGRQRRRRRL